MAEMSLSERAFYSTTLLVLDRPRGTGYATGLRFNFPRDATTHIPVILTNKHVAKGTKSIIYYVHLSNGAPEHEPTGETRQVVIPDVSTAVVLHPDPAIDLCAFPIGSIFQRAKEEELSLLPCGISQKWTATEVELASMLGIEPIVTMGYPIGFIDEVNHLPIARRGSTAFPPRSDFKGEPHGVIDAGCFPGCSGSPVFALSEGTFLSGPGDVHLGSRIRLLGVLWGGGVFKPRGRLEVAPIPLSHDELDSTYVYTHLGVYVKVSQFEPLGDVLRSMTNDTSADPEVPATA